jgi:glycosyltransferase involved in cell wall biosynthesis
MRVLHVMASGARGGGADHLVGLLPELKKRGVRPSALVGSDGPLAARLAELGLPVETLDMMGRRVDPTVAWRVARHVRAAKPDIVHLHGTRAAFFAVTGRLVAGRLPFSVYTAHGLAYRKEVPAAERAVFLASEAVICRAVDEVISVSRADLEDLVARRFLAAGHGTHVANAVDARFAPGDRLAARRRAGLPETGPLIGTVARLVPQKSVGDLIEAAALIEGAALAIIGDGAERASLARRAAPIGDRVHFLGERDDVAELLPALDIFVLPSRWEGEPLVLLQALAAGVPCVATATTGAREILEPTGAGVLVPIGDAAAIAAAVTRLLGSEEERARLVEAGLAAVAERTWEKAAAKVITVYSLFAGTGA